MNQTSNHAFASQAASPLTQFFRAYETNTASGDTATLVAQFADPFMAAGPTGVQCLHAADFAAALPRRRELFAGLGAKPAKLVSCRENRLDARYVMAETRWQITFVRDAHSAAEVFADSLFIVDTAGDSAKIVFYLAHQDLLATLRDQGILPAESAKAPTE